MRLAVESGVLFQRALREIPRVPTRIAFPVIGPVMQLVLLTAVLSRVTQLPGYPARSSVQFMTAGVLSLTVLAGAGGAGFQMVQDIDTGFFDKLRVAPISRAAIVLGLLLTDATRLAVQSLVVILLALLPGSAHRHGHPRPARHARAGGDLRRGLVGHLAERRAAHAQSRGHRRGGRAHLPALLRLDGVHAARPAAALAAGVQHRSTRSTT